MRFFARTFAFFRRFTARAAALSSAARKAVGSWRMGPYPIKMQWFLEDIGSTVTSADTGILVKPAQLAAAFSVDGRIQGLLGTRAAGLFSLPRVCTSRNGTTPLCQWFLADFDRLWQRGERVAFLLDYIVLGAAIAEILEDANGDLYVVRLPPEHLIINPHNGEIRYLGEEVTPGNGRWIYLGSTLIAPWRNGIWQALARAFISKDHAYFLRESYSNTLANPARVAEAPVGASDEDFEDWFQNVLNWGPNTSFATREGYSVKIVESNGQGYQVFRMSMEDANEDAAFAVAGQTVTSEGSTGFVNPEIFAKIRSDLIDHDGAEFCRVVNAQLIPHWQRKEAGTVAELSERIEFRIDTEDPARRAARVKLLSDGSNALKSLRDGGYDTKDLEKLLGVRSIDSDVTTSPQFFGYDMQIGYMTVNEARQAKGLDPIPGGEKLLMQFLAEAAAANGGSPPALPGVTP